MYKIARRASALRQANDSNITFEKVTDNLSQANEAEGQFLACMAENDRKKLAQLLKHSSTKYDKLDHRTRLQAFIAEQFGLTAKDGA